MKFSNKCKFLCVIFFIINALTACSYDSGIENEKASLHEIYENKDSIITKQYDNLVIPKNISLRETDKLYRFSIRQIDDNFDLDSSENKEYKEKFIKLISDYSGTKINSTDIDFNVYEYDDTVSEELCYIDKINSIEYTYSTNGTFSIVDTEEIKNDVHGSNCVSFNLINASTDLEKLKGIDGFSISEAINICDNQIVDKIGSSITEDKLNIYSVSIFKNADATYSYYIVYAKEFLGLNLSESGEYLFADTGFVKPTYLAVQINEKKEIYSIMNMYSNIYDDSSIKEIEGNSFISLETACGLLSDYLAEYNVYNIENIDLVYFLPTRFEVNSSKLKYTEYIPGYEITLLSKLNSEKDNANLSPRKTAYIDIITGDIYISDSIDKHQYFVLE